MTRLSAHRKSEFSLLFTVLIWGTNLPILKAALSAMPIHVLNVFRFSVSLMVIGAIFLLRNGFTGQSILKPFRSHGRQIVSLGLLGYFVYQFFFIVGINYTTAGNTALIMAGSPIWTAVISRFFRFEHLRRSAWIGLLIVLTGTFIVILFGRQEVSLSSDLLFGNIMVLAASMMWGAYTAFSRPVVQNLSPISVNFLGLLVALPFLIGLGLPFFDEVVWEKVDLWVWAAIIYSGGLSTGLTFVIWTTAVREVGPSHTAVYNNLVPLIALISSYLLLAESISLSQIFGGLLIIGGLLVIRKTRAQIPSHRKAEEKSGTNL